MLGFLVGPLAFWLPSVLTRGPLKSVLPDAIRYGVFTELLPPLLIILAWAAVACCERLLPCARFVAAGMLTGIHVAGPWAIVLGLLLDGERWLGICVAFEPLGWLPQSTSFLVFYWGGWFGLWGATAWLVIALALGPVACEWVRWLRICGRSGLGSSSRPEDGPGRAAS